MSHSHSSHSFPSFPFLHSLSSGNGGQMKTIPLGKTGETISAIGYGGMPLSIQGRPPEDAGRRAVHAAIDAGMTFIDTADVYCLDDSDIGHNERLIASAVRERPDRDQIRIATKAGLRRPNGAWTREG